MGRSGAAEEQESSIGRFMELSEALQQSRQGIISLVWAEREVMGCRDRKKKPDSRENE